MASEKSLSPARAFEWFRFHKLSTFIDFRLNRFDFSKTKMCSADGSIEFNNSHWRNMSTEKSEGFSIYESLNSPSPTPPTSQSFLQNEYVQHAFYILYIERFDFSAPLLLKCEIRKSKISQKRVFPLNVPTRLFLRSFNKELTWIKLISGCLFLWDFPWLRSFAVIFRLLLRWEMATKTKVGKSKFLLADVEHEIWIKSQAECQSINGWTWALHLIEICSVWMTICNRQGISHLSLSVESKKEIQIWLV